MDLIDRFQIGDMIIVSQDLDHDDPIAAEYLNKHATILAIHLPYVEVQFLNGDIHSVLFKNIKSAST